MALAPRIVILNISIIFLYSLIDNTWSAHCNSFSVKKNKPQYSQEEQADNSLNFILTFSPGFIKPHCSLCVSNFYGTRGKTEQNKISSHNSCHAAGVNFLQKHFLFYLKCLHAEWMYAFKPSGQLSVSRKEMGSFAKIFVIVIVKFSR